MRELNRILVYMALFTGAVALVCVALLTPLRAAFVANEVFNGMILAVLVIGIAINVRQVFELRPALGWLLSYRNPSRMLAAESRPGLLAPLQALLRSVHTEGFRLPALTMRTMLDSIRMRLDESRELSRYMTGLLIFLGLLGTFWGLLETVRSVAGVVAGLSAGADLAESFEQLKRKSQGPVTGMGTAFSSSLFGLGGALILGFLDLQAGHAQNRFYNQLEEWLSELIHLPAGTATVPGAGFEIAPAAPGYAHALVEQTAEQIGALELMLRRGEDERRETRDALLALSERIGALTDQLRGGQRVLEDLAQAQRELGPAVSRLADGQDARESALEHLRSVDANLAQLARDLARGQEALAGEVRHNLRLLARVLGREEASGSGPEPPRDET